MQRIWSSIFEIYRGRISITPPLFPPVFNTERQTPLSNLDPRDTNTERRIFKPEPPFRHDNSTRRPDFLFSRQFSQTPSNVKVGRLFARSESGGTRQGHGLLSNPLVLVVIRWPRCDNWPACSRWDTIRSIESGGWGRGPHCCRVLGVDTACENRRTRRERTMPRSRI